MAEQRPGACHDYDTLEDLHAVSDANPPVSCVGPHVSETMVVRRLPAPIARRPSRPSIEELRALASTLPCGAAQVSRYVGSDRIDPHAFLAIDVKFPTVAEWAKGERRFRCDLRLGTSGIAGKLVTRGALRGIMHHPASATIRPCLNGPSVVSCGQAHQAEIVGTEGPAPGSAAGPRKRFATETCPVMAAAFLGAQPRALGLTSSATEQVDGHTYCVVATTSGGMALVGTSAAQANGAGQ